ncbi:uncharacterized protein LOC141911670 [Tubulanus polymorphus]|uniref:uncharacterized protein LOC141911670 n=1 Tax=Tubulanus polymorphus TaxID=672921 RepID=UPI003DA63F75
MVEEKEYMPLWWAGVPAELYKLRVEGRLCDITIVVGNSLRYSVHSLVLVSASSHFKASLDTGSLLQEYYLQDADEDCFKHLMEYVYGQNLVLNKDNVHAMLSTARALFIDSAISHCEEFCKLLPRHEKIDATDGQQSAASSSSSCKLTDKSALNPPSPPEFNNSLQLDASTSFSSDYLSGYDVVEDQKVLERGIKQEPPENFYPGENIGNGSSCGVASKGSDVHVTYEPITVGGKTVAMRSVIHENLNSRSSSQLHHHGLNKYSCSPPDPDKPKNKTLEFICAQLSNKKNTTSCGVGGVGQADSETSTNDDENHMYSPNPFSPMKNHMELSWQPQGFGNSMRLCSSSQIRSTPTTSRFAATAAADVPVSAIRREKDKSKYISTILNLRSQNSSPESMSPPIPSSSSHSMDTNPVWSTEITPSISEAASSFSTVTNGSHYAPAGCANNESSAAASTSGLANGSAGHASSTATGSNVASMNAATNALLSSVANQQAALQSLMMSMAGGTLPGLSGLMPGNFNGQFGANVPNTSQTMGTGANSGLGLPPLLSGQLPSQALQCLSALTANAQALGQLLPPMPGLLPSQVLPQPSSANGGDSPANAPAAVKYQSQTLSSTAPESTYANVPDSSTESCAAAVNTTNPTPVDNSVAHNTNAANPETAAVQNQGTLSGLLGFNPPDTLAANQNQQFNQALQQQGLPPIMLPAAGQNLINVNMAGVNPMLPMALFMLPNGNASNSMMPGIAPQSFLPGVGPKIENDSKMEDEETEVENMPSIPESAAATLFDCPICHKPFPNTKQRAVHMRIHSKYEHKPFVCDICGFRTKYADRLRIHKRLQHTHKGIKPFKCPYCPYATSLKGNCRKHVMNKHPNCAVIVEQIMPI